MKLFQPTTLQDGRVQRRAHLLDLSVTGALVHAAEPPTPGDWIRIEVAGEQRMARVAWCRGKRFGVHFAMPLTLAEVTGVVRA